MRTNCTSPALAQQDGRWHAYENEIAVSPEDIEFTLRALGPVPWAEFLLNPRRLRGSDFLMRWSQGRWSEDRLVQAVEDTGKFFATPYGPSGTAPDDAREFELYFERLEHAGLAGVKRPDLLVFAVEKRQVVERLLSDIGGLSELPFTQEGDARMVALLAEAILAVECENSLWKSKLMPGYGSSLTPQRRLGGKPGLKKTAVLPTVIIKEEDRAPLARWEAERKLPIHIWHVFFDQAFGLSLSDAESLVSQGLVEGTEQVFQAPGGATTRKVIYKFPYLYAYRLGESTEEPKLIGSYIQDKNGHILPYVRFEGGRLELTADAIGILERLSKSRTA